MVLRGTLNGRYKLESLFSMVGSYPKRNGPSVGSRTPLSLLKASKFCQCVNYLFFQFCKSARRCQTLWNCASANVALLLPLLECFTDREYQSIAQYHGHSLRCLSLVGGSKVTQETVTDLLHSLPHLHTLDIRYERLSSVGQKKIVNSLITNLTLDLRDCSTNSLSNLDGHFPAFTTLSLCTYTPMSVFNLSQLLYV